MVRLEPIDTLLSEADMPNNEPSAEHRNPPQPAQPEAQKLSGMARAAELTVESFRGLRRYVGELGAAAASLATDIADTFDGIGGRF